LSGSCYIAKISLEKVMAETPFHFCWRKQKTGLKSWLKFFFGNKKKKKTIEQIMKVKTSEEYWTLVHLNLEFQVLHAAIYLHK